MANAILKAKASDNLNATHKCDPIANTSTVKTKSNGPMQDTPATNIEVCEVSTREQLESWLPAWRRLVETALEPNVFYEPEMLLAALGHYGERNLRFLLAYSNPRDRRNGDPVLCGLLPLAVSSDQKQTRLPSQETWRFPQAFLTTPLIRREVGLETLTAFWRYFANERSAPLWINFNCISADGPFNQVLIQFLQENSHAFFVRSMHRRAFYQRSESADAYFARWSGVRRHSVTRLEKRLSERGELQVEALQQSDDADLWLNQFLELEARGWKGRTGTALSQSQSNQQFTAEMLRASFQSNKLMLLAMTLDEKPVAMKCNLLSGDGGYAWKIAYDERLFKFSPGCILEKMNIEQMHKMPSLRWMDSCAMPNHPMIDSLWLDRRTVQSISVTTARRGSQLALASLPILRWLQQTVCSKISRTPIRP